MSVPNQKVIKIKKAACNKQNLYTTLNLDSLQKAMVALKGEAFKLWLYFAKNQDKYEFELSRKAVEDWGIKKSAYYEAMNKLEELGYLVPAHDGSNHYIFIESGDAQEQEAQTREDIMRKYATKYSLAEV